MTDEQFWAEAHAIDAEVNEIGAQIRILSDRRRDLAHRLCDLHERFGQAAGAIGGEDDREAQSAARAAL